MAIDYYNDNAEEFFARTVDADMSDLRARFAARLPPGGRLLDAGCGSGRDARAFREMGLQVSAIDGSAELAKLARAHAGVPVEVMDFREVAWREAFDGIWACASLLHLTPQDLPGAVRRLRDALVPGGYLEMSFQYGDAEGVVHGRWFTNLDEARAEALVVKAGGLKLVEVSVNGDSRPDHAHERWLRVLCARIEL